MLIWAASVMLLSPTQQYIWSFPWQITEQKFNSVDLTLGEPFLLPNSRAGILFFSFPPPLVQQFLLQQSVLLLWAWWCCRGPLAQHEPFLPLPLGWTCSPAFRQLRPALGPPYLQVSPGSSWERCYQQLPISHKIIEPLRLEKAFKRSQLSVCPFFKPQAWRWYTARCFSIFSSQILNTLMLTEKKHAEAFHTALPFQHMLNNHRSNAKYARDKITFSYSKWAPRRASQSSFPPCELPASAA